MPDDWNLCAGFDFAASHFTSNIRLYRLLQRKQYIHSTSLSNELGCAARNPYDFFHDAAAIPFLKQPCCIRLLSCTATQTTVPLWKLHRCHYTMDSHLGGRVYAGDNASVLYAAKSTAIVQHHFALHAECYFHVSADRKRHTIDDGHYRNRLYERGIISCTAIYTTILRGIFSNATAKLSAILFKQIKHRFLFKQQQPPVLPTGKYI